MPANLQTNRPRRIARPRRPTMADVARACGVARSTVSGILSNRPDCIVSPQTRQRVLDAVRRTGYRPNLGALSLVSGRSMTVGIVGVGLFIEVTTATYIAFEQAARRNGYLSMIVDNPNDPATEDRLIQRMLDRNVDGLLVFPSEHGEHRELRRLAENGFPVVTIDGEGRVGFPVDDVSVDYRAGGAMQAQHLLTIGRRRVCIVNSAHTCRVVDERMRGLSDALVAAGCEPPTRMDLAFEASPEGVMVGWTDRHVEQVQRFIEAHPDRFDAYVGVGDHIALLALAALRRLGVDVPGRAAVVGFDGTSIAHHPLAPLTTIVNPAAQVGQAAFDLMMRRMSGEQNESEHHRVKIQPTLAIRGSTVAGVASPL